MVILQRESAKCAYLWAGAATTCVSLMLADIQTPKAAIGFCCLFQLLSTPPSVLSLCSVACYIRYVLPLPHMAVTYVRQTGPLLCAADGNANWSRVRSLTQQPSANALNSARAGGLQRGVCVIFVAYKALCTWPQRNYLRLCQRWGITFALAKIKRSNCN